MQTFTSVSLSTAVSCPNCWNSCVAGPEVGQHKPKPLRLPHTCVHTYINKSIPSSPPCRLLLVTLQHFLFGLGHFLFLSAAAEFMLHWGWNSGGMKRGQGHSFLPLIIFNLSLTHTHNTWRKTFWKLIILFPFFTSSSRMCAAVVTLKTSYKTHVTHLLEFTSGQNEALWNCGTHIILNRGTR